MAATSPMVAPQIASTAKAIRAGRRWAARAARESIDVSGLFASSVARSGSDHHQSSRKVPRAIAIADAGIATRTVCHSLDVKGMNCEIPAQASAAGTRKARNKLRTRRG